MIIFTYTDFGYNGPYMGQMKAALMERAPHTPIIDLMVDAPFFDISASALLLSGVTSCLQTPALYLCIVDPGVGGERRPICLKIGHDWYVGPDNGLFHFVMNQSRACTAYEINWRPESLSQSFHGRDLFAPVAAMVSQNDLTALQEIPLSSLVRLKEEESLKQKIIYIDDYGNCWTGLCAGDCREEHVFNLNGYVIKSARVFSDVPKKDLFWYINSSGFIEIAMNQGNAAELLNVKVGSFL